MRSLIGPRCVHAIDEHHFAIVGRDGNLCGGIRTHERCHENRRKSWDYGAAHVKFFESFVLPEPEYVATCG